MTEKYVGRRVKRNEDPRLLTGQALFVDDVEIPGMLYAAFYRSDYAHATLKSVDVSAALEVPGVIVAYSAADMGDDWATAPPLVSPPPTVEDVLFHSRTHVPLVKDKVRHVGEPIAMVIAESRYIAEDALDRIVVDLEPLKVVSDIERALEPGSPLVHDDLDSNLAAHLIQKKGDYAAAREAADLVIKRRIVIDRGAAGAMENRGIVANWDAKDQHLTIWDTTQAPIPIRNGLAAMFDLSEHQVRVIAPFIGGGFGPKIMMYYPEEVLLTWATLKICRPIKWIEDRRENFFATTQERGQVHEAEIAMDKEGHILGLWDEFLHDSGAYDPYGLTIPLNTQCHMLGPYDIPNFYSELKVVFTNKTLTTPVRGAGRPQGVFVIERLLDLAADELGLDKVEIRNRNFLPPDVFPYDNIIIDQAFAPFVIDSGNYAPALERAAEMIGYEQFIREEQPRLRGYWHRLLHRNHGGRTIRGRSCHDRIEREGERSDGCRHAGSGSLYILCPGRRGSIGREGRRRPSGDRRHGAIPLGHGYICQPRRGGRCERDQRRRHLRARKSARVGQQGPGGSGGGA